MVVHAFALWVFGLKQAQSPELAYMQLCGAEMCGCDHRYIAKHGGHLGISLQRLLTFYHC